MQTLLKTLLIGAIFTLGTNVAAAADPAVGTWKLNVAKSTYSPGPAPKSQTRTYVASADGLALILKTTAADGKESTVTVTFKPDGKPYPATGSPDFDTVTVTKSDDSTVKGTQMKAGVVVGNSVRMVSKDGKTLTFKQKGAHASGVKFDDVAVYDRQ